ncbi:hypothetical protein PHYBOEH_000122 [Phytophthora boehmeriae]|uniref:Fibronectin type-III domain-containing protein n=1 Tax=Phytophthora boehmeriae TaxID=109152 RepID=A0A8T1XDZ9_9STRA|nr:hypothetical protein PHYBOEH_000122 [Phytophthora boehmeriae]
MTTLQLITFAAFVIILNGVSAVTTTPLSLPSEPRNLSVVSCTGGAVVLTWLPPLDLGGGDITTYDVSFFAVLEPNVQLQQQVTGISPTATNVTAKVVNLLANSTYGFSVSAVNDLLQGTEAAFIVNTTNASSRHP